MEVCMSKKIRDYLLLSLGTLLVSAGVYVFKFPNNFSTGGVSGISIILGYVIPNITPGTLVLVINVLLLILGFIFLGKSFGIRTVYCSLLMSLSIYIMEQVFPLAHALTDQKLLELIFAVMLPAVGSAILFNMQASTGGTDILAMILRKYTNLDIGKALFCADACIVLISCLVFGAETGLFSILGLILKAAVVDTVIESINLRKYCTIITSKHELVEEFIMERLRRGATVWKAYGSYTHTDRYIVLAAVKRAQAQALRQYVRSIDPSAFILITNTSEIIGKGFRGV